MPAVHCLSGRAYRTSRAGTVLPGWEGHVVVTEILFGALLFFCYVYTCITYSQNTFKMSTAEKDSQKRASPTTRMPGRGQQGALPAM